jgi:hypothetical protein
VGQWTLNGNTFIQNTGHDVVHSIGSAGLETTDGKSIASPGTVFAVVRYTTQQGYTIDGRGSAARVAIISDSGASGKWQAFQGGSTINLTEDWDALPHVHTFQFNGDSSTKYTVSNVGNVQGDAGTENWDYGSLFVAWNGTSGLVGYISQLVVFDRELTEIEVAQVQGYLLTRSLLP